MTTEAIGKVNPRQLEGSHRNEREKLKGGEGWRLVLILSETNLSWEIIVVSSPSHLRPPCAKHWVEGIVYQRAHWWGC